MTTNDIIAFTSDYPSTLKFNYFDHGTHNGYLALPPNHTLNGMHYTCDEFPNLNQEITYSEAILPRASELLTIDNQDVRELDLTGYWIIGFDTFHSYNSPIHDRNWVISELEEMIKKLK